MMSKEDLHYAVHVIDANVAMNDPELMRTLRSLTLHGGSGMNNELDNFEMRREKGREIDAFFILARKPDKTIIGWALLSEELSAPSVWVGGEMAKFEPHMGSLFEVFVANEYRRMGVGNHLLRIAQKISFSPVQVVPWSTEASLFFGKAIESKLIFSLRDTINIAKSSVKSA